MATLLSPNITLQLFGSTSAVALFCDYVRIEHLFVYWENMPSDKGSNRSRSATSDIGRGRLTLHSYTFVEPNISSLLDDVSVENSRKNVLLNNLTSV